MSKQQIDNKVQRIAERLRTARLNREMSQQFLAEKAGIDRKTINRIENGHFSPSVYTLLAICDAMKVEAREIIGA